MFRFIWNTFLRGRVKIVALTLSIMMMHIINFLSNKVNISNYTPFVEESLFTNPELYKSFFYIPCPINTGIQIILLFKAHSSRNIL